MDEIKVSVIIPVYNAEKYLRDTLESVIGQTFYNMEIICVDDMSDDCSVQIIKEYMMKDDRIVLYYQREKSDNAALARNLGLKNARGKYLLFLDADDVFEKDMISLAYQTAIGTDAEIVMFNAFILDTNTNMDLYVGYFFDQKKTNGKEMIVPENEKKDLFHIMGESVWNKLYKRDLITDNGIVFRSIRQCDDYEFVALAAVYAKKIALLNKRLLHYRKDANCSQTSDYSINWKAGYLASYYLKMELETRGLYEKYKVSYVNKTIGKIIFYLKNLYDIDAFRKFFNSIKRNADKLGIFDISYDDYDSEYNLKQLKLIMESDTAEDYLFKMTRSIDLYHRGYFRLPICDEKEKRRVILYGAGQEGRRVYNELKYETNIKIVGWLDKEYKQYGLGIQAPESINDIEYDYVFIAIESKKISQQVKKYLVELGCQKDKIIEMDKKI